tara:strand:+ start:2478 stop:2948 length:471 start_codon:yes stop_codon:yes gene_type:complete
MAQLDADLLMQVREGAMRLLARREHSCAELRRKLAHRKFEPELVDEVLAEFVEQDLLSDTRYAHAMVAHRAKGGYGPGYVRGELREHGVTPELIQRALDEAEVSWYEVAMLRYRSHFPDQTVRDFKDWARRAAYLQRRGFSKGTIRQVLGDWQSPG